MQLLTDLWPPDLRNQYGDVFPPRHYCTIDTETTGFHPMYDFVYEIGHCLVSDGVIVDRGNWVLDLTKESADIPLSYLRDKADKLQQSSFGTKRMVRFSPQYLREHGTDPFEVLEFYKTFFDTLAERNVVLVGHNVVAFDLPRITNMFESFHIAKGYSFDHFSVLDTMGMEKFFQLVPDPKVLPASRERLTDYMLRLCRVRFKNVKANLDDHCFYKYDLGKHGIVPKQLHCAGMDAYVTHLLLLAFHDKYKDKVLDVRPVRPVRPITPVVTQNNSSKLKSHRRRGQRNL